jgi:hypothetical protein
MQIMKLNYLKEKKEVVSFVLLGVSALLAVLILIKVGSFFAASVRAERLVKMAVAQNNTDAKDMEKYFAESKTIANKLKRENLFAPPPPKQNPVKEVWGIFGDEVLIEDKWYKVGDKVGDAKIVAIGPTSVKIEWDGKEKAFAPIDAVVASASVEPMRPVPDAKEKKEGGAEKVVIQFEERPIFDRGVEGGFGPGGGPGFPGGFDMIRERFQNMSEAEKERLRAEMQQRRERWESMSEAERDRFRTEMRERFGGGRPPDNGRGQGGRQR